MGMNCIFCKIINGQIPSEKVYEDEDNISFMDIEPFTKGHVLVIPKAHYERITDIPGPELASLFEAVARVSQAAVTAAGADGFNLLINHGKSAGQEVPHLHVHIIPRTEGERVFSISSKVQYKENEMSDYGRKIREKLEKS